MDILSSFKRGKAKYLACIECGKPKKTWSARTTPLCISCAQIKRASSVVDGKKKCVRCGVIKPVSEFYRQKRKTGTLGLQSECKPCKDAWVKAYRAENWDKELERVRRWRLANPEKSRRRVATEEQRANKSEYNKAYQVANAEKIKKTAQKRYERRKDSIRQYLRSWKKNNPEKVTSYHTNRRARKLGNGGIITAQEWKFLKEKYNYTCLACGRREPEIKLTLDHVIPVVLGGLNTIDNAQPLCQSCNSRKNSKAIDYRC